MSFKTNQWLWLVMVTALLLPFQNCSLHKSQGRQQLEDLLSLQTVAPVKDCLPYLSTNTAQVAVGDPATGVKFIRGAFPICLISFTNAVSQVTYREVMCLVNQESQVLANSRNAAEVEDFLDSDIEGDILYSWDGSQAQPNAPSNPVNGFGFLTDDPAAVEQRFIFARPGAATQGVRCEVILDPDLFLSNTDFKNRTVEILSNLTGAMQPRL